MLFELYEEWPSLSTALLAFYSKMSSISAFVRRTNIPARSISELKFVLFIVIMISL